MDWGNPVQVACDPLCAGGRMAIDFEHFEGSHHMSDDLAQRVFRFRNGNYILSDKDVIKLVRAELEAVKQMAKELECTDENKRCERIAEKIGDRQQ